MKNNLKTFPEECNRVRRLIWKDDFEEELKEDLPWICENCYIEGGNCSPTNLCNAMKKLKEILGEKENDK